MVQEVRIHFAPPASLNCGEIPPPFLQKYAKDAHFSRLFAHKPDCRECIARQQRGTLSRFFLRRAHAQSGFREGIGRMQCNAITSRDSAVRVDLLSARAEMSVCESYRLTNAHQAEIASAASHGQRACWPQLKAVRDVFETFP